MLSLYLVRRSGPDDCISIRRRREGFQVDYRDGESRVGYRRTFAGPPEAVRTYVAVVLSMLSMDVLPFHQLQLTAPGYPSVMYAITDVEPYSTGWYQVTHIVAGFLDDPHPWVTVRPIEAPSGRSDETDDEDDARTEPVTPRFERL